jgi:transcriptional regulator with XRE-family HTH domain
VPETFGERLKRLRERAGMSQPKLAEAAGVPVTTLRTWEQGRREPLLGAALKLAVALRVTLDELAGRDAELPPQPDTTRAGHSG